MKTEEERKRRAGQEQKRGSYPKMVGPGTSALSLHSLEDVCDYCGEVCDSTQDELNAVDCSFEGCPSLAIYHQHCIETHLRTVRLDKTRKAGFQCPRGLGKATQYDKPCPGKVTKSHLIYARNDNSKKRRKAKMPEVPQVSALPRKKTPGMLKPAAKGGEAGAGLQAEIGGGVVSKKAVRDLVRDSTKAVETAKTSSLTTISRASSRQPTLQKSNTFPLSGQSGSSLSSPSSPLDWSSSSSSRGEGISFFQKHGKEKQSMATQHSSMFPPIFLDAANEDVERTGAAYNNGGCSPHQDSPNSSRQQKTRFRLSESRGEQALSQDCDESDNGAASPSSFECGMHIYDQEQQPLPNTTGATQLAYMDSSQSQPSGLPRPWAERCVSAVKEWKTAELAYQLQESGFSELDSRTAVRLFGTDLNKCALWILDGAFDQSPSPSGSGLDVLDELHQLDDLVKTEGIDQDFVEMAVITKAGDIDAAVRFLRGSIGDASPPTTRPGTPSEIPPPASVIFPSPSIATTGSNSGPANGPASISLSNSPFTTAISGSEAHGEIHSLRNVNSSGGTSSSLSPGWDYRTSSSMHVRSDRENSPPSYRDPSSRLRDHRASSPESNGDPPFGSHASLWGHGGNAMVDLDSSGKGFIADVASYNLRLGLDSRLSPSPSSPSASVDLYSTDLEYPRSASSTHGSHTDQMLAVAAAASSDFHASPNFYRSLSNTYSQRWADDVNHGQHDAVPIANRTYDAGFRPNIVSSSQARPGSRGGHYDRAPDNPRVISADSNSYTRHEARTGLVRCSADDENLSYEVQQTGVGRSSNGCGYYSNEQNRQQPLSAAREASQTLSRASSSSHANFIGENDNRRHNQGMIRNAHVGSEPVDRHHNIGHIPGSFVSHAVDTRIKACSETSFTKKEAVHRGGRWREDVDDGHEDPEQQELLEELLSQLMV